MADFVTDLVLADLPPGGVQSCCSESRAPLSLYFKMDRDPLPVLREPRPALVRRHVRVGHLSFWAPNFWTSAVLTSVVALSIGFSAPAQAQRRGSVDIDWSML